MGPKFLLALVVVDGPRPRWCPALGSHLCAAAPSQPAIVLVAWLPWRCCVGLAGGTRRNLAHPGGTTALDLGRWSLFCCFSWFGFQGILLFSTARSDWPHPPVAPVVAWLARWCA